MRKVNCEDFFGIVSDFIEGDPVDIYDGKLSYAYRFEMPVEVENGKPSGVLLEDDLERVWTKGDEVFGLR